LSPERQWIDSGLTTKLLDSSNQLTGLPSPPDCGEKIEWFDRQGHGPIQIDLYHTLNNLLDNLPQLALQTSSTLHGHGC